MNSPVSGEVCPEFDDISAELSLFFGKLLHTAIDRHLVGELAAERRTEHVIQLDRVKTVARRREMILVYVRAVHGNQICHIVSRCDHVHVR